MTQERDKDSEFDAYLQGKSGLSDLYADLPPAKLPEHLDAAILAEAHRAVHARPGGKPRRSWVIPLSMAASLFVAVIIGAQLRYLAPVDMSAQPPRSEPGGAAPGPAMRQAAPKTEGADEMAPRSPVAAPELKKQAIAPPAPAAPALGGKQEAAVPQQSQDKGAIGAVKMEAYENKPAPGEQGAPAAAAVAPPAAQTEAAPMAAAESPPQNVVAPQGNAPRRKAKKARGPAEGDARVSQQFAPAAPVATASAPVAAMADTANPRPEDWLARIRQLKQQGKLDEAKKELAAFKKRYPAYTVPKDLEMR